MGVLKVLMSTIQTKKLISIIIPAYNEEKNIARLIKDCQKLKKFFPIEIVVVDGGSKDSTIEVASRCRVDKIIAFPNKRGKGADFWSGAVAAKGDYIIQIDADYQFLPSEVPMFVEKLKADSDVIIGSRFQQASKVQKGSITSRNLFGNRLMSLLTSIAAGRRITDVMAGFKGFKRQALLALDLRERHFEYEAEIVVKAARMGMDLVEIPISYRKRLGGESGIRAVKDGLNVTKAIIRARFQKLPAYKPK